MSQKDYDMSPRWYVVHTYSGYENKVKTDLEKTVKNISKKVFKGKIMGKKQLNLQFMDENNI